MFPLTSAEDEVAVYEAMIRLRFSTTLLECITKRLRSALGYMVSEILTGFLHEGIFIIWHWSLMEDDRSIRLVQCLYITMCTKFETLYYASPYMFLEIVSIVFHHFLFT